MMLYQITLYHNNESRFMPYEDGQRLTTAVSHWLDLPAAEPEVLAIWAFDVFNADLDYLEQDRTTPGGELNFLAGCVYRLLSLRSLSVGDVLEITTDQDHWWLACEFHGWKRISTPSNLDGQPLTAEKIYAHLRADRSSR